MCLENLINLGTGYGTLVLRRKCLREWHSAPISKETRLPLYYFNEMIVS